MATIFMRWPDPIKGNATAEGGEPEKYNAGWIDASSIAFNVERSIKQGAAAATNREAAHPVISQITVSKVLDASSTLLFQESVTGTPKPVKIHLCSSAADGKMRPWATIDLTNCIIASYKISGEADGAPKEELSLAWTKLEFVFQVIAENNIGMKPIAFGYDLARNTMT